MAPYQFGKPIPCPIDPIHCSYNVIHEDGETRTCDGIYAECHSENTWCPICGRKRFAFQEEDKPCPSCSTKSSLVVAWIFRECLAIKTAYLEQLLRENRLWKNFCTQTYENRRWLEACVMRQRCKISLGRVADALGLALADCPGSGIGYIFELHFATNKKYGYNHCAFLIETKYGDLIFDPTGPQFGPSWPVVATLDNYIGLMTTLTACEPLGSFKDRWVASQVASLR